MIDDKKTSSYFSIDKAKHHTPFSIILIRLFEIQKRKSTAQSNPKGTNYNLSLALRKTQTKKSNKKAASRQIQKRAISHQKAKSYDCKLILLISVQNTKINTAVTTFLSLFRRQDTWLSFCYVYVNSFMLLVLPSAVLNMNLQQNIQLDIAHVDNNYM